MPNRFHVMCQLRINMGSCLEPRVEGSEAVSGFHYKECSACLAMSAMAIPTGHVWNGEFGAIGCVPATSLT